MENLGRRDGAYSLVVAIREGVSRRQGTEQLEISGGWGGGPAPVMMAGSHGLLLLEIILAIARGRLLHSTMSEV